MYNQIWSPLKQEFVPTLSKHGKQVLKMYINSFKTGGSNTENPDNTNGGRDNTEDINAINPPQSTLGGMIGDAPGLPLDNSGSNVSEEGLGGTTVEAADQKNTDTVNNNGAEDGNSETDQRQLEGVTTDAAVDDTDSKEDSGKVTVEAAAVQDEYVPPTNRVEGLESLYAKFPKLEEGNISSIVNESKEFKNKKKDFKKLVDTFRQAGVVSVVNIVFDFGGGSMTAYVYNDDSKNEEHTIKGKFFPGIYGSDFEGGKRNKDGTHNKKTINPIGQKWSNTKAEDKQLLVDFFVNEVIATILLLKENDINVNTISYLQTGDLRAYLINNNAKTEWQNMIRKKLEDLKNNIINDVEVVALLTNDLEAELEMNELDASLKNPDTNTKLQAYKIPNNTPFVIVNVGSSSTQAGLFVHDNSNYKLNKTWGYNFCGAVGTESMNGFMGKTAGKENESLEGIIKGVRSIKPNDPIYYIFRNAATHVFKCVFEGKNKDDTSAKPIFSNDVGDYLSEASLNEKVQDEDSKCGRFEEITKDWMEYLQSQASDQNIFIYVDDLFKKNYDLDANWALNLQKNMTGDLKQKLMADITPASSQQSIEPTPEESQSNISTEKGENELLPQERKQLIVNINQLKGTVDQLAENPNNFTQRSALSKNLSQLAEYLKNIKSKTI